MQQTEALVIATEIINVIRLKGNAGYAGEPISQLEHATQSAQLAINDKQQDDVVLAALLHDIGHLLDHEPGIELMDGYGVMDHESIGASYLLQRGFGFRLAQLISSHVDAKRYLCAVNKRYYNSLSDASKATLAFQGGPMNEDEIVKFESIPDWRLMIKMRSWDEQAKQVGIPVPDLEQYHTMIVAHLVYNNRDI